MSKSAAGTAVTAVRHTITNLNESEDYSVGPVDSQRNVYVMHDPVDQPFGFQGAQQLQESSVRAANSLKSRPALQPAVEKRDPRRQLQDQKRSSGHRGGNAVSGEQLGLLTVGGGEDVTTQALKTQSRIRRNGLMLEHIMRQRGQQSAENQVLADLHQELRNIEKREGTYSYKGATLMPGQRSEAKPPENKYLLVQVRRHVVE